MTDQDKQIIISDYAEIGVNNNVAIYNLNIVSEIYATAKESYLSLQSTQNQVKKHMDENNLNYYMGHTTDEVVEYIDGIRKLLGFKTIVDISYNV